MTESHVYVGDYPGLSCRLLVLTYIHSTMDMSVANSSERMRIIIIPDDAKFPIASENWCGCGVTKIVGYGENERLILNWHNREYILEKGEMYETETLYLDNPYLSREEISMNYEYCVVDAIQVAQTYRNIVRELQQEHTNADSSAVIDNKDIALKSMWHAISNGHTGFYPAYALMMSCKNWYSFTITDMDTFTTIMRKGIAAGCFDHHTTCGVDNLVEVLRFNPTEEIFSHLPELKGILQRLGEKGNEIAQWIADGEIACIEKIPREDPELKHNTLAICYWDKHEADHGYWLFVDDEIRPGATADMGEMGMFKIDSVNDNIIEYTWDNRTHTLDGDYDRVNASDREHQLVLKCRKYNLWKLLKDKISHVVYGQVSSNPFNKYDIEETKEAVIKLTERLIAGGDNELTELLEALKANEDWRCFDYDGELRHLLQ